LFPDPDETADYCFEGFQHSENVLQIRLPGQLFTAGLPSSAARAKVLSNAAKVHS
jgi:hypothetical protein